jgi:succinoglycan biosynthesis protein ExoM
VAISPAPALVIAVLTYRRPDDLATALPLLIRQAEAAPLQASVLVVDNDPDAGARRQVQDFGSAMVTYVHEPRPGIAAARSRALAEAQVQDASLLVFIDDDEVPSEDWLASLLKLQGETGATAVVGPVISEYAATPDPWIIAGEFFRRRRLPTGTALTVAATNNLLLDLGQVRALGLDFNQAFGLMGGEDTLFTRQLVQRGGTMVWCDEALVVDRVPASRLTRSWVLRRAYSSGNSWSRVALELAGSGRTGLGLRARLLGSGAARVAGGAAKAAVGTLSRSPGRQAKGLRTLARGAGMTAGAVGARYSEYRHS